MGFEDVALDDLDLGAIVESTAKRGGEQLVEFDRDDVGTGPLKRGGDAAGSCADLHDEIAGVDACLLDDLPGELIAAE
jgi:hypothetical protein